MDKIKKKYEILCKNKSDINEHLHILYKYASNCETVLELGVRGVISSYALIYGLLNNNSNNNNNKIILNDINSCNVSELLNLTEGLNIDVSYQWINDLNLELNENVDLTFIDTWHVYGQLKRELDKFSKITNKYIIMHDTTVDEIFGESIRCNFNIEQQSLQTGIPVDEIQKGLWPAITDFLNNNNNWKLKERFTNNNGLTILEKIN